MLITPHRGGPWGDLAVAPAAPDEDAVRANEEGDAGGVAASGAAAPRRIDLFATRLRGPAAGTRHLERVHPNPGNAGARADAAVANDRQRRLRRCGMEQPPSEVRRRRAMPVDKCEEWRTSRGRDNTYHSRKPWFSLSLSLTCGNSQTQTVFYYRGYRRATIPQRTRRSARRRPGRGHRLARSSRPNT